MADGGRGRMAGSEQCGPQIALGTHGPAAWFAGGVRIQAEGCAVGPSKALGGRHWRGRVLRSAIVSETLCPSVPDPWPAARPRPRAARPSNGLLLHAGPLPAGLADETHAGPIIPVAGAAKTPPRCRIGMLSNMKHQPWPTPARPPPTPAPSPAA